jgi:hypothetical protein
MSRPIEADFPPRRISKHRRSEYKLKHCISGKPREGGEMAGRMFTSSGESLSVSSAIFGTTLLLGDRCLSIVPPGLLERTRGFSVATLARRPRIVEGNPAGWLEFATLGDARRRRDEALRCSITATFCDSYGIRCVSRQSSINRDKRVARKTRFRFRTCSQFNADSNR